MTTKAIVEFNQRSASHDMGVLKPPRTAIASPESIIGRNQKNLQIKMGVTERATTINDNDCTSTRASQQNQLLSDITSNQKD